MVPMVERKDERVDNGYDLRVVQFLRAAQACRGLHDLGRQGALNGCKPSYNFGCGESHRYQAAYSSGSEIMHGE